MRDIDDYILTHIDAEPEHLHRLWRATNLELLNGRMASGHLQGRMLKMLVAMIKPRNVLEVGTFSGYSALCMAEGLADDDCRVYTFEVNDEVEDFTRRWIEASPVGHRVSFAVGDALQLAPALGITFDMAFLDGDKRTYVEAYEMALTVVRSGGFIIADNTLWDGHIVDSAYDHDHQTQGIRRFNDYVADDARIEKIIIPIRDGLTIMKKK